MSDAAARTHVESLPGIERRILARSTDETFDKSVESRPEDDEYVSYDGPPFANALTTVTCSPAT